MRVASNQPPCSKSVFCKSNNYEDREKKGGEVYDRDMRRYYIRQQQERPLWRKLHLQHFKHTLSPQLITS